MDCFLQDSADTMESFSWEETFGQSNAEPGAEPDGQDADVA